MRVSVVILFIILAFVLGYFVVQLQNSINKEIKLPPSVMEKSEENELVVVAAGDVSCAGLVAENTVCQQESTARLIEDINPEFVLALGDLQYETGAYDSFINFYDKSWGRFKSITKPIPGNHDYGIKDAAGYFKYFNGQAGDPGKGYYAFEKNGWKFYALNSNCWAAGGCGLNSPQGKWLEGELVKDAGKCQIAYFHHPLFSSGPHGPDTSVKLLWQILYEHNVDLVLNGHDHLYERFAPLDPDGKLDEEKGIREFIAGTGGRNLYKVKKVMPNSEVRIDDAFGVLRLNLKEQAYDWQFISITNKVLDSGNSTCR